MHPKLQWLYPREEQLLCLPEPPIDAPCEVMLTFSFLFGKVME